MNESLSSFSLLFVNEQTMNESLSSFSLLFVNQQTMNEKLDEMNFGRNLNHFSSRVK